MYKHLLIPISFDESRDVAQAIAAAKILADDGAKFSFIHVIDPIPGYVTEYIPPEMLIQRTDKAKQLLHDAAKDVDNAQTVLLEGATGRMLTDWAADNEVDCIVIASHHPAMSDIILGSTAAWVVRHAGCAVHVIR
ncbi:MAG: universal stress protein [Boseongicola sp.]|nr:universal stress protein [Boseongicola sp.]MDD9978462.1 universal stress protein [Boseongicola sp.]